MNSYRSWSATQADRGASPFKLSWEKSASHYSSVHLPAEQQQLFAAWYIYASTLFRLPPISLPFSHSRGIVARAISPNSILAARSHKVFNSAPIHHVVSNSCLPFFSSPPVGIQQTTVIIVSLPNCPLATEASSLRTAVRQTLQHPCRPCRPQPARVESVEAQHHPNDDSQAASAA